MHNNIYDLLLHSNTFNFIIFLTIIILVCKFFDISSMIEDMCNKIRNKIEDSKIAHKDAQDKKEQAIKSCQKTAEEIESINSAEKEKAKTLKEEILKDTENKIQNIRTNTERIILSEEKATTSALISNIGLKSVETAKAHIISEIANNKELHSKFIEDSLEELKRAVLNDIH